MKKSKFLSVVLFIITLSAVFSIPVDYCYAQWLPDVRLSYTDSASVTCEGAKEIASIGNYVHAVWADGRHGYPWEIYYKRSTDQGVNWGPDTRLTTDNKQSFYPTVKVSGSTVHLIWHKWVATPQGYYYKRSNDNGQTWSVDALLILSQGNANFPYMAVSGNIIHVVWQDYLVGNLEIYYKRSTDGGTTWSANERLTNNVNESSWPCVAVSGSDVHVVWADNRFGSSNFEIMYKRSTDYGVTWGTDTRITNAPSLSAYCDISVSGPYVHVVWEDYRTSGNFEMFYKRSTDGGATWEADNRLTYTSASNLSVVSSGALLHATWLGYFNAVYYKRSENNGTSCGDSTRLTEGIDGIYGPSMSLAGDNVHVLWSDTRNTNNQIYYKRNPTGNTIGIHNISTEIPLSFSLSQNYPNPFNPSTSINFAIPIPSLVRISVFDMLGKEVEVLVNEQLSAGTYKADWNASKYSSGAYFYKIQAGNFIETKQMLLIK